MFARLRSSKNWLRLSADLLYVSRGSDRRCQGMVQNRNDVASAPHLRHVCALG